MSDVNSNYLREMADMRQEIDTLRRLLWSAHNDGTGYGDDGEMQLWMIDFKRDPVSSIEDLIMRRRLLSFRSNK